MKRPILFSDLDGTLLDHETYSFEAARPALARLKRAGIPLILASSKTAAEIASLQAELGLADWPAIVENGAGIVWPREAAGGAGNDDHEAVLAALGRIDPKLGAKFSGFSDWNLNELAARTGLSLEAAERARRRQFSEPGILSGTPAEREAFLAELAARGLTATTGGRFLTISKACSKAGRMREIAGRLVPKSEDATIVCLGDAPNDIEMLEAADIGVIVANPAHDPLPELTGEREGRISRTSRPGPAGWADAVCNILDKILGKTA